LPATATALGHLATLSTVTPGRPVAAYLERMQRTFEATTDPAAFRARTAAAILALASGPFPVWAPDWPAGSGRRIDLAERWLAAAR
jgi:hypothetical protein